MRIGSSVHQQAQKFASYRVAAAARGDFIAMQAADVVVVGAGVAGLACAHALAREGVRVLVLERASQEGGRARSWADEVTGLDVDIGPHVLSTEHRNFLALMDWCGTREELQWQREPLITLLDHRERLDGKTRDWTPPLHGLPNLPMALRRLRWRDLLSHLRLAWSAARVNEVTSRSLDAETAASYLRRKGVSERAIDWFWRSAMLALLNLPLEQISAASMMRIARLLMGRSGYHFAFPKCGLSDLYVPGSRKAVEAAGGQVVLGADVSALRLAGTTFAHVQLESGEAMTAAACVLAVPPAEASVLLGAASPVLQPLATGAAGMLPAPYISTYLWLDRKVTGHSFWARIYSPEDLNTDFYDVSNIRPELASGGSVIACNSIGPQVRHDWTDEQVIARSLQEVADFAPQARDAVVRHARVHRVPMAIPQPRPGFERARPPNATAVDGLWVAGDWTDTAIPCSMESAARSGFLAAEGVLARLGRPRKVAIDAPETYGLPGLLRQG